MSVHMNDHRIEPKVLGKVEENESYNVDISFSFLFCEFNGHSEAIQETFFLCFSLELFLFGLKAVMPLPLAFMDCHAPSSFLHLDNCYAAEIMCSLFSILACLEGGSGEGWGHIGIVVVVCSGLARPLQCVGWFETAAVE